MPNEIIPYNPRLKDLARSLRRQSTLCETLLWKRIKGRALNVEFHRQVPILEYIVDFYCHELRIAIEIDGGVHRRKEEEDIRRQSVMEQYRITFIRFTNNEIKNNITEVIWRLEETIKMLKVDAQE